MACPTQHFVIAKRVSRYSKGTINYDEFYRKGGVSDLIGFTDSDYAGDMEDSKNTWAYIIMMSGERGAWSSCKKSIVTLSTKNLSLLLLPPVLSSYLDEEDIQCHDPKFST